MADWTQRISTFRKGATNALELIRGGRLTAPYRAPFEVVHEEMTFRLRRYTGSGGRPASDGPVLLLVPPLMVTSEIYDIAPELSAVALLVENGVDTYVVDFGAPEIEEGGLQRTLDDHILAVDRSIDLIRERRGRDVHLAGYSQGGMFVYQTAAYRRSEGLASLITFGSPVDIHRNLPAVRDDLAGRLIDGVAALAKKPLEKIEGLPGLITSTGFKVLSAKKEAQQFMQLLGMLHDREALAAREKRRRFLAGEGFVAWPGPAFRKFVDEFVVHNRMTAGGFIIANRTVTLADLEAPILCFVGTKDEIARPASVRAIARAAPQADVHEVDVAAGHFGLVVGSRSLSVTWPTVMEWIAWHEGEAEMPERLRALDADSDLDAPLETPVEEVEEAFERADLDVELFYELATGAAEQMWTRLGDVGRDIGHVVDALRWQLPRMAKLKRLSDETPVGVSRALAEQAAAIPDATFFLWQGRAFTYAQAHRRVSNVARGLISLGVRPGERVAVMMSNRPSYLSAVAAINRLGAVAVLIDPDARGLSLSQLFEAAEPDWCITDPERGKVAHKVLGRPVFVLGGGGGARKLTKGLVDMESIDPDAVDVPADIVFDGGLGGDVAMLIFTSGTTGLPKPARITNRRWALAALGTAAAAKLTTNDTVYCALPLHHATAMLVCVGGALVGGCRLALAPRFSVSSFWPDVRRYGASVAFYVGEMCRFLVDAPQTLEEANHPLRLLVGNGMRKDVWERVIERFGGVHVLEFYASTEGNAALANLTGDKVGSVGRELPGSTEHELILFDGDVGDLPEDEDGWKIRVGVGESGLLIARIDPANPVSKFDGYADPEDTSRKIIRGAFEADDAWFVTGDLLRRDEDGDWFFIDRIGDTFRWRGQNVSTELVAQVIRAFPAIAAAVVYGVEVEGEEGRAGMAAVTLREGSTLDGTALATHVATNLPPASRPLWIRQVESLDVTESFKYRKTRLRLEGARAGDDPLWAYDRDAGVYRRLD